MLLYMMLPKHASTYLFICKILWTSPNYISFHFLCPACSVSFSVLSYQTASYSSSVSSNCYFLCLLLSPSLSSTICLRSSSQLTSISSSDDAKPFRPQLSTPQGSKQRVVRLQMLSTPLSPNVEKKQYTNRKSLAGNQRCIFLLSLMSSPLLHVVGLAINLVIIIITFS